MSFPRQPTWQGRGWLDLWWARDIGNVQYINGTAGAHALRKLQQKFVDANYPARPPERSGTRLVTPSNFRIDGAWGELTQFFLLLAASEHPDFNSFFRDALQRDLNAHTISQTSQKWAVLIAYHPSARWDDIDMKTSIPPGWNQPLGLPEYDSTLQVWVANTPPPQDPARPGAQPDPATPAPPPAPGTPPRPPTPTTPGTVGSLMPSAANSAQQEAGITGIVKAHPVATALVLLGALAGGGYAYSESQKKAAAKPGKPSKPASSTNPSRALPAGTYR
jgi:hypothetical protein